MPFLSPWRRALAVPVVLSLAIGGALLTAGSASAAESTTLTVTSPTEGQTVDSRTVVFTGAGTDGDTVNVLDGDGNRIPGTTAAVVSDGEWTTTGTYPDDAEVSQTVHVNQVEGGAGRGEVTRAFSLPAVNYGLTVTSPTEGETVESRTVVFEGAGTDGATVNVLDADGNRIPGTTAAVVSDGKWTTTGTYPDLAADAQTVFVNQVIGGAGRGDVTVDFLLPAAPLLAAPVITSPTNGQALTGSTATFSGTGKPGSNVALFIARTAALNALNTQAKAKAAPADPEDPIVVDSTGSWTVTVALQPDDYTVVAVEVTLDAEGNFVDVISEPSAPVEFTLAAAAVAPIVVVTPTTPATTTTTASNTLAATGVDATGFVGLSALLLLAGAVLMVLRRTRRAD